MYLLGYITYEKRANGVSHQNHIDVYYDEMTDKKLYRTMYCKNGQMAMDKLHIHDKNHLDFHTNAVIKTFSLNDTNNNDCCMLTSDIHKALLMGINTKNIFNSLIDIRNHIDEQFGRETIKKIHDNIDCKINNAISRRFESLIDKLNSQADELNALKKEIESLHKSKNIDALCIDLLQLDDHIESDVQTCNGRIIEY